MMKDIFLLTLTNKDAFRRNARLSGVVFSTKRCNPNGLQNNEIKTIKMILNLNHYEHNRNRNNKYIQAVWCD
jgi:carboxypeptidase C (cathepsin A)